MQILQPAGWKRPKGYANGVAASGRMLFVAGQVGWDADEVFRSEDLVEQIRKRHQRVGDPIVEEAECPPAGSATRLVHARHPASPGHGVTAAQRSSAISRSVVGPSSRR